ncbi:MAG: tetratricopeptide repeat protein [Acidobacteria bacterium]|nr:tetratricopeptide repeat protein [Acidobacteriota bacterium]
MAAFLNPWTLSTVFQVLMVVHFIRHRPEGYWFWVILSLGPLGATAYFFVEVLPGFRWEMPLVDRWERRRRRQWLERIVSESPTQEALSELAWSCGKDGDYRRAIELFSEALDRDPHDLDSLYGRGLSAIETGDYEAAVKDLRALAEADAKYKLHQGNLALAKAYEGLGDEDKAIEVYRSILDNSPISRAYWGLGELLAKRGETEQAREMMQAILTKQLGLPRYLRRQERPWVWRARRFLKTLAA